MPRSTTGLYGAALKKNLGLSQGDLDTISTAFFVAGLLSWAPGLFADRYGPRLAICIGGLTGCASLLLYWAIAREYVVVDNHAVLVTALSLLGVATFESSAMVTGSVFKVLTVTAGPSKGAAVGVAKGLVGLGSGVYTVMFESVKTSTESDLDFLPLAAVLFACCASLPALLLIPSHKALQNPTTTTTTGRPQFSFDARPWHFRLLYCALLGMALLIVSDSLKVLLTYSPNDDANNNDNNHQNDDDESSTIRGESKSSWTAALLMFLWWGPLLLIYARQKNQSTNSSLRQEENRHESIGNDNALYQTVLSQEEDADDENIHNDNLDAGASGDSHDDDVELTRSDEPTTHRLLSTTTSATAARPTLQGHTTATHPDRNLLQMLQTPEAYCLLWSACIMVGSGTVETNNMGQMVEALGLPSQAVTPASMALFSVAQATARVVTGAASEATLQAYGWPRPVYLVVAACVGVGAHIMLGLATSELGFVVGATLSGINFGMVWPLLVLCTGEIFGPAHVGANYMFYDGFASAAGTLFLSKMIAQDVYEAHIDPNTSPDAYTCLGTDCFRSTHFIIAALCATCIISSIAFVRLTKDVYQPVVLVETASVLDDNDDQGDEEQDEEERMADEHELSEENDVEFHTQQRKS